jgi:uncharacterized alkaline shock family protein YloU
MSRSMSSEYGQIKIHKRVYIQIAETAARQVKGVCGVGWECYGKIGKLLKFFGAAGTRVFFDKELNIIIPVSITWDENIVDIAYEVQKKIIFHALKSLNIEALRVDVKVKRAERG